MGARRIPLAMVPGDAREDTRLGELCTVPAVSVAMLEAYLRHGGPANLTQALRLAAHLAGRIIDPADCVSLCWTSGTESVPKGVPRTHGDWIAVSMTTVATLPAR